MKIAAYQAPLEATCSTNEIIGLLRKQIDWCESKGIEILCCPEAVIGGLADYADHAGDFAIDVGAGQLQMFLAPLASDKVTTILGFSEIDRAGLFYNSAAIFYKGSVMGVYRKLHPAVNKSVYSAGEKTPVFRIGNLTFGIIICNDSNFREPIRNMVGQGAKAIFIPTNNGLPAKRFGPELVAQTREVDVARAVDNNVYIIRADVAGSAAELTAYGTSEIVGPNGKIITAARYLEPDLIVAEIVATPWRNAVVSL
jgi:5-aminopentanamidase